MARYYVPGKIHVIAVENATEYVKDTEYVHIQYIPPIELSTF